jgi:hypothetical protein
LSAALVAVAVTVAFAFAVTVTVTVTVARTDGGLPAISSRMKPPHS